MQAAVASQPDTTSGLTKRSIVAGDEPYLRRLYASTREAELALVDWPPEAKEAFVRMQFDAQDRHYRAVHASASFDVVLWRGEPAGRLIVARYPGEIRVVDITLAPEVRGRGLGSALLGEVVAEAQAAGMPVRLSVEPWSRALALYRRLGFVTLEESGAHLLMEWRPSPG